MVKLTAELIEQAAQYTNAVRDRELDLRGEPGPGPAACARPAPRARPAHAWPAGPEERPGGSTRGPRGGGGPEERPGGSTRGRRGVGEPGFDPGSESVGRCFSACSV